MSNGLWFVTMGSKFYNDIPSADRKMYLDEVAWNYYTI
jgi:hypothetical protein